MPASEYFQFPLIVQLLGDIKYGNRSFCDKSMKLGTHTHLNVFINF